MRSILTLHHPTPPFKPLRELTTAVNVDRVHPLNEPGSMSFELSQVEGAMGGLTEGGDNLGPLVIKEGMAIVDRSTEGIDPWLWYVQRLEFNIESGMIDVECAEWRDLLYRRTVPLEATASSRSAGSIATQLLAQAGARSPTHIMPPESTLSGLRVVMPEVEQPLGGLTLGDAFDQLAVLTETEWWVDYSVSHGSVELRLRWSERHGIDRVYSSHLAEGFHLTSGAYARDGSSQDRLVQVVGGGGSPADRPSGGQAIGSAIALERSVAGGRIEAASESARRRSLQVSGPAVASQALTVMASVETERSLVSSSRQKVEIPVSALQQISATANARLPWSSFGLGDTLLIRFAAEGLRKGVDAPCRITAIQPDEASGELLLALEVQA